MPDGTKKNRKRICVIVAQVEENTQNRFMTGFLKKAYELDYDVCIFSMFLKYQESTYREVGDSNIYNLINFDLFEAVVLCLDTVQTTGVAEKLQKRIQAEFHGVVVVIDKESEAFRTIMMDHYTPIVKLVSHLVEVHGYKNIYFLNGLKGHIHSEQRLAGYLAGMKEHGLTVTDDMIYYGTYWYDSGDYMVDELARDREHLPDAIVCANDCMAIGVCTAFERYGIHVPEDIAVVGYDSIEDGRNSPVPITSADIPAYDCGQYCMDYIHAELEGRSLPEFRANVDLYVGGTCGCGGWEKETVRIRRDHWATDLSATSFNSCFNNMMDDLVAQTSVETFFNTVFQYVYQIRPFDSFHLCLNSYWRDPEIMTGDEALRYGYTDKVHRLIKCGAASGVSSVISYDDVFDSRLLLPELYEERDYPTAYIFSPLFFQDRSFGYAVVGYGREPRVYEETYRSWIKTVARDIESFARHESAARLLDKIEAGQIRDGLTGLYNYRGFMSRVPELVQQAHAQEKAVLITVIDLKNTRKINNLYGREEGDKTLQYTAQLINELSCPGELSMRVGNDEFVIASLVTPGDESRAKEITGQLTGRFEEVRLARNSAFDVGIYYGSRTEVVTTPETFEHLLNEAVNEKNRIKAKLGSKGHAQKVITDEDLRRDDIVDRILDENLLTYHFQPIVNAQDGGIFAYEALMRVMGPEKMSPPQLLESAARLGRLYDVERYTLFNVVDIIAKNPDMFRGKKVFINSMPGHMLDASDRRRFVEKVKGLECDGIVIEFTEGDELGDEELLGLKTFLKSNGIEFAIDDYGSGYSNVNNLLRYMPNYVKIDRMLLTGIDTDPHRQHFVKDIIEFTEDNDIVVLAEGVETAKEMKTVIQLGTNLIQGYYTARPDAEIIQQIAEQVAYEIIQYNQSERLTDNNRIYIMEHAGSLSLLKLTTDNYKEIVVKSPGDGESLVRIEGAPGFNSDITLRIEEGFAGTIELQNASFAGEKMMPCIDCGENTDVTLVLEGYNLCRTGGVRVPESASLTVMGEGDLKITLNSSRYYGIGNDLKSTHGRLRFLQDGAIEINANGMNGVGIGSGYGGDIELGKGRYDLRLYGQSGVAIGSVYTPKVLRLSSCDMNVVFDTSHGVVFGSCMETADVSVVDSSIIIKSSGSRYTAIGSLEGDGCVLKVLRAHIEMNMRGRDCRAIGSRSGYVDVSFKDAYVQMTVQGENAVTVGSGDGLGSWECRSAEVRSTAKNSTDADTAIPENDIQLTNCKCLFMVNGREIERHVAEEY